jgi:hypothetical protein
MSGRDRSDSAKRAGGAGSLERRRERGSVPPPFEPPRARRRTTGVRLVLLLAFALGLGAEGWAQPRANLEVFEEGLREVVSVLLDSVELSRSVPLAVEVRPQGSDEAWFVETRLLQELGRRGFRLVAEGSEAAAGGNRLTLHVDRLAVAVRHRPAMAPDSLEREVSLQLSGWLRDERGHLLWGGLLERRWVDVVSEQDLSRLEESPYEFTYARLKPKGSRTGRILESLAAGVAAGVVTFLFFSYRTR